MDLFNRIKDKADERKKEKEARKILLQKRRTEEQKVYDDAYHEARVKALKKKAMEDAEHKISHPSPLTDWGAFRKAVGGVVSGEKVSNAMNKAFPGTVDGSPKKNRKKNRKKNKGKKK